MLNQFPAEWTKLRSTASFWWTTGLIIAFGALFGALFGWSARLSNQLYVPTLVVAVVALTTIIIVIVQQSMIVTTEYRYGIQATNFRLRPKRWEVAVVKLLLGALIVAVASVIAVVAGFVLGDLIAPVAADWKTGEATQRALWAVPLGMVLLTLFVQGVGWLTRNTTASVVIGLGMMFVIETIVALLPKIGQDVVKYMPFSNLMGFMNNQAAEGMTVWQSLGIFAAWAVVVWVLGVVSLTVRDA
ncbi:ABC-2 family transporter protein [Corynebacterium glaucum]|uniref:ABC-2 family transporter protein n=1 Tax=Corynebacterium glaucum TaxID=187491 RepID=A0A1Q2HZ53_9CORY|nr:ABC transporter permease [Corynebacterium glaucum]AQQ16128.1 ABC-2 family transporter protein [Corynebacterium glaucum]